MQQLKKKKKRHLGYQNSCAKKRIKDEIKSEKATVVFYFLSTKSFFKCLVNDKSDTFFTLISKHCRSMDLKSALQTYLKQRQI